MDQSQASVLNDEVTVSISHATGVLNKHVHYRKWFQTNIYRSTPIVDFGQIFASLIIAVGYAMCNYYRFIPLLYCHTLANMFVISICDL